MELMLLRVYQRQVREQCSTILRSWEEIDRLGPQVWPAIQQLVGSAANVSKLLWGGGGKRAVEREPLRASIGVADSSPLHSTEMRNHFEHIDQRLDAWWANSPRHNHADQNIGPYGAISGIDEIDSFRLYDPDSGDLWFWGDSFNLKEIVAEVQRIYPIVQVESEKPHWIVP